MNWCRVRSSKRFRLICASSFPLSLFGIMRLLSSFQHHPGREIAKVLPVMQRNAAQKRSNNSLPRETNAYCCSMHERGTCCKCKSDMTVRSTDCRFEMCILYPRIRHSMWFLECSRPRERRYMYCTYLHTDCSEARTTSFVQIPSIVRRSTYPVIDLIDYCNQDRAQDTYPYRDVN